MAKNGKPIRQGNSGRPQGPQPRSTAAPAPTRDCERSVRLMPLGRHELRPYNHPKGYCWRIQKVGKDTTKKVTFLFSVGNVNHLCSLRKIERPFESRIRQQYPKGWRPSPPAHTSV